MTEPFFSVMFWLGVLTGALVTYHALLIGGIMMEEDP